MKKYTTLSIILLTLLAIPASASAASVFLESSRTNISVGDTIFITAKIDSEGVALNTVDGAVALKVPKSTIVVKEFSLANSSFGLWPRTPSLSIDGTKVTFVGGVPGGFNIKDATLFKMVLTAQKEGILTLSPDAVVAYLNDGSGTKVPVHGKDIIIHIDPKKAGIAVKNDWDGLVSADLTPPEDFIIVLGQEKSLFEGRKFAFFSAVDNQSGIDHYLVSENGAAPVRSGSMYVLTDQDGGAKLTVTAVDKALNKKVATYSEKSDRGISWPTIIVSVIILIVLWKIIRKKK